MSHTKLLQCFYKIQEENLKMSDVDIHFNLMATHNQKPLRMVSVS